MLKESKSDSASVQTDRLDIPLNKEGWIQKAAPPAKAVEFLQEILGPEISKKIYWDNTKNFEAIDLSACINSSGFAGYSNTQRINNIRRINKYFEHLNEQMEMGHHLVLSVETKDARKQRLLKKYPPVVNRVYYFLDFLLKRVMPKWKPTRKIYFSITKGRNRVISLTEAMGRVVCCGFSIVGYKKIGYQTWIIAKKISLPVYDMQPTYGAIIKLRRVGKDGKIIHVLKLRTMYPYSEYLQEYIYEKYKLEVGGKFNNDFRNTSYGKWMRKYWLDELPMFINYFKGELKLVGVRPLSRHYFELYPEELRKLRIQVKPGLIPPYYADLPSGLDEIQASEKKYIESYLKAPYRTDISYFFKSIRNILFRRARSS